MTRSGFSVRSHMAEAKRSPLWRRVSIHIAVKHLDRLDALRTPYQDRAYVLSDALDFAFKALDKIEARGAKREARR